ncbi:MAG TPA: ABC transporter permease [Actinomycetota bacterium]|jgi:peptide/nickel transport system permease protein|nr:ABC transporter permease [Actinomycetota bacterium]
MIRSDTLNDAPEEIQPDLAGGHKNWLRKVVAESTQAKVGLIVLGAFVLIAIFAPLLAPYDPRQQVGPVYGAPSLQHPLGLDDGGVDMLSLLIYGGRISLIVGFCATVIAMVIGGGIGIFSGYYGGRTDQVLMRTTDYFLVIPDLPLAIIVAAVWGPSLEHLIFVIALLLWTTTARIIRAQVKSVRERVYVKRARSLGASDFRIITRHVLPQIGPLLIANTVLTIAVAIFDETALAFLGLADPTSITWGTTIEFSFLRTAISTGHWWAVIPAGLCVALVIMACFWFGQAIEDALNPRLKVSYVSPWSFRLQTVRPGECDE